MRSAEVLRNVADALNVMAVELECIWAELGKTQAQIDALAASIPQKDYEVMSLDEAAEAIGVSVGTVRSWTRLPKDHPRHLPFVMINGKSKGVELEVLKVFVRRKNIEHDGC